MKLKKALFMLPLFGLLLTACDENHIVFSRSGRHEYTFDDDDESYSDDYSSDDGSSGSGGNKSTTSIISGGAQSTGYANSLPPQPLAEAVLIYDLRFKLDEYEALIASHHGEEQFFYNGVEFYLTMPGKYACNYCDMHVDHRATAVYLGDVNFDGNLDLCLRFEQEGDESISSYVRVYDALTHAAVFNYRPTSYDADFGITENKNIYVKEFKRKGIDSDQFLTDMNRIGDFVPNGTSQPNIQWEYSPYKFRAATYYNVLYVDEEEGFVEELIKKIDNGTEYYEVKPSKDYLVFLKVYCDGPIEPNFTAINETIKFSDEGEFYTSTLGGYDTSNKKVGFCFRFSRPDLILNIKIRNLPEGYSETLTFWVKN